MKDNDWKFFVELKQFCRHFVFEGEINKSLFVGTLITVGKDNMNIRATGTDNGYCVCVNILKDVHKEDIDELLNAINDAYEESIG